MAFAHSLITFPLCVIDLTFIPFLVEKLLDLLGCTYFAGLIESRMDKATVDSLSCRIQFRTAISCNLLEG
jgi:hypothetical protein